MELKNNVTSFDVIRTENVGRYVILDPYMTGKTRFAFCEGEKECVFKQATKAKTLNRLDVGNTDFYLDTNIEGGIKDSYLKVNNKFYLIYEIKDFFITTEPVQEVINESTEVELYSVPIYTTRKGKCCQIKFGETIIHVNGISYTINQNTSIEDVLSFYNDFMCSYHNGFLYFSGSGYSENTYYKNSDEFPIESKILSIKSYCKIARGDEILMFNDDIRGNLTTKIIKCLTNLNWWGYESFVEVDKLDSDYNYSQLRAYSAYFSKVLDLGSILPFIPDICYSTVFGSESNIEKGFILYNNNDKINNSFDNFEYVARVLTKPNDLLISMNITYGKVIKINPFVLKCNKDGLLQFKINTPIKDNFLFKFNTEHECKLSLMDFDGNILYSGSTNSSIESSLHERTFTFKSLPHATIEFSYFGYNGKIANKIEYYFIAKNKENARMEVNGLHLNQILKPYKELLAVIGNSKVGEGRIAL